MSEYVEYADCVTAFNSIDMHDALVGNEQAALDVLAAADIEIGKKGVDDYRAWLPFAAEEYNISSDLKDYVVVPVTIMPTDLPNRNGVAFPYSELTRFNPMAGMLSYRTWKGKPTFEEHNNKDWTKAKGIIFDSKIKKIENSHGDLWKVVCLCAFDRGRDAKLANSILTSERKSS
jgi:hypothetical protein